MRAKRVQRRQWSDVLVSSVGRRCTLDTSGVEAAPYSLSVFENDSDRLAWGQFADLSTVAECIHRWTEQHVAVEQLAQLADKWELEKKEHASR